MRRGAEILAEVGITAPDGGAGAKDAAEETEEQADAVLPAAPEFPHKLARGPLRDLMDWAEGDGLPVSLVAASAEVAAATAAAGRPGPAGGAGDLGAHLRLTPTRRVLPVLWEALIAGSGSGKNPSINAALTPLTDYYAAVMADWAERSGKAKKASQDAPPRPQALIQSSVGIEPMARWLSRTGGSGLVRNGELASFLKGLGQYKAGGGSDRYDAMDIWSSEPISIERVGDGGSRNAVQVYVPCPRVSVIGGLVPENVRCLGSESDGLRARFLPVLPSSQVIPNLDGTVALPSSWVSSMTSLLDYGPPREWFLRGDARGLMREAMQGWKARQSDGIDPVVVKTALAKTDEQCLRIALSVAESETPGKGGNIPVWAVLYAIARVDYSLGCWLSLGSDQVMAFSRKDEVLNAGVADLLRAIEARTPGTDGRRYMTRRDIQMSQVAGATTPPRVDELVRAYLSAYPGCVIIFSDKDQAKFPGARKLDRAAAPAGHARGLAPVVVYAPPRRLQVVSVAPQRTLGKLLDPTVSQSAQAAGASNENAGQSDEDESGSPQTAIQQFPSNSFQPNSFPPDGGSSLTGLAPGSAASATAALRPPCAHEPGHGACAAALMGRCVAEKADSQ